MRFFSWLFSRNVHQNDVEMLAKVVDKVQRLENQVLQIETEAEALRESHYKLLKRTVGRLGGRPTSQNQPDEVADLSGLTKDQLRQHFADEIKRRGPASRN